MTSAALIHQRGYRQGSGKLDGSASLIVNTRGIPDIGAADYPGDAPGAAAARYAATSRGSISAVDF